MCWKGEQTTDEMAILFLSVMLPSPADVPAFQRDVRQQLVRSILQSSFNRWWNGGQTAN